MKLIIVTKNEALFHWIHRIRIIFSRKITANTNLNRFALPKLNINFLIKSVRYIDAKRRNSLPEG